MRKTTIFLISLCFTAALQAQNPYIELSYPWLNAEVLMNKKVKSILLATIDSDGKTVLKQTLLSFNNKGQLISEEGQIGFRYKTSLMYNDDGFIVQQIFTDEVGTDTTRYSVDPINHKVLSLITYKSRPDGIPLSEKVYHYSSQGILTKIEEFSGVVNEVKAAGSNGLELVLVSTAEMKNGILTIKGDEIVQSLEYLPTGILKQWQIENETYGITETFVYQYDQNGLLVLIDWSQSGATSKTFLTYEYY